MPDEDGNVTFDDVLAGTHRVHYEGKVKTIEVPATARVELR